MNEQGPIYFLDENTLLKYSVLEEVKELCSILMSKHRL